MRLIDADKINYHEHTERMGHGDFETVRTVTDKEIAEIPTVDAVEVVRCLDCKHWDSETWLCDNHSTFGHHGLELNMFSEDDFCSYGERKDGDVDG